MGKIGQAIKKFFTTSYDDSQYDEDGDYLNENEYDSPIADEPINKEHTTHLIRVPTAPKPENYKLIKVKPRSIEDATYIDDILKENKTAVVDLTDLDLKEAQRIVDFMAGLAKALNAKLRPMDSDNNIKIYHVLPAVADMSDEHSERLEKNRVFGSKSTFKRNNIPKF